MKSRGNTSTSRRVGTVILIAALFSSLVTLCWGKLGNTGNAALAVLGPTSHPASLLATTGRAVTPGLVNLTHSPAQERQPAWSPDGSTIAFLSNGVDTNADGRIDTETADTALFTMRADGSGLRRYPVAAGSVQALAWRADGQAIYLAVSENGTATICVMDLTTKTATEIYSAPNSAINALSSSANDTLLFFEKTPLGGIPNIFVVSTAGGVATPLTSSSSNRHPSLINMSGEILFESNRDGSWRVYRMGPDGGNVRPVTVNDSDLDTRACATADGRLVFATNRMYGNDDLINDTNIWVMPLGEEHTGTPPIAAAPRFFADFADRSTQTDPAPQVLPARADEIVFASNKDGNYELYIGSLVDTDAPYITEPPIASPKVTVPGGVVKVSVPVVDSDSGVRNVWLQIKDPDPAVLDSAGMNHVITKPSSDWRTALNGDTVGESKDVATQTPVEFGPWDPSEQTYLDLANPTSHPGYYARAGATRLFSDEGQGEPNVPSHWVRMYDNGTHGDAVSGDGIYTCQWTTPTTPSDWYFDVIVEDTNNVAADSEGIWHGHRRRFDNVGGCSTVVFASGHPLLLVDDYMDGQRFVSAGLPPVAGDYDAPAYLNSLYYFSGMESNPLLRSPFVAGSSTGGADVWRLLCRGPVPAQVLNSYLPSQRFQVATSDGQTEVAVKHGDKAVVWVSPSAWFHLIPSSQPGGSGSLIETAVQTQVSSFVNGGGRLFVIGADLATGLTANGTRLNAFLTNTLGANLVSMSTRSQVKQTAAFPPTLIADGPAGTATTGGWYGNDLPAPRWLFSTLVGNARQNVLPPNDNKSQYVVEPSGTEVLRTWDQLEPMLTARRAFLLEDDLDDAAAVNAVGVSNENVTSGGRSVFWTFGYEHISAQYRTKPTLDTLEWLMDGTVTGTVVQMNTLQPIAGALVLVTDTIDPTTGASTKRYGAARTDAKGKYTIYGIRPGKNYTVQVIANGFYGTTSQTSDVRGGVITDSEQTKFLLYRDVNTATIWGYVSQDAPVANATVTATPMGGGSAVETKTDSSGRYEFTNLASGPYQVTASHPQTHEVAKATPNPDVNTGESRRADISFTGNATVPGALVGSISGNGAPIPGAAVEVRQGTAVVKTAAADLHGSFTISGLPEGSYTIEVSAPGFSSQAQTVNYDPVLGLSVYFELTSISGDESSARICGRVYDSTTNAALGGAKVQVLVHDAVVAEQTTTDTFSTNSTPSNFDFSLYQGVYTVRITAAGKRTQTATVSLSPGQVVSNLQFRMEPLYTISTGVVLFSLPGNYSNMPLTSIFGMTPEATSQLTNRVATYDTDAEGYVFHTPGTPMAIQPGRAYWIRLDAVAKVQVEGSAISTSAPFEVALQKGWNLVGNPFPFNVDMYDCGVRVGANALTWQEAQQNNLIGGAVYTWNSREYIPSTMLEQYRGYWVYTTADCTLLVSNRSAMRGTVAATRSRRAAVASNWQVRLEARAGDSRDTSNFFGVSAGETDGFNNTADLREAPMPIGEHVTLSFPHRNWGTNGGDFATDMRAPLTGEKVWSFQVTTNQANTDVVLSWPDLMAQLPAGYQVMLTDSETLQRCYCNTTSQYVFRSGPTGATRSFTVTVGPRMGTLAVTGIRAIGAGGGRSALQVAFTVSEAADVNVIIRNQTGKVVRTLARSLPASAGVNSLLWDGRDDAGHAVPRGNYLCEVRAVDATGRQVRGTGLLWVSPVQAH